MRLLLHLGKNKKYKIWFVSGIYQPPLSNLPEFCKHFLTSMICWNLKLALPMIT